VDAWKEPAWVNVFTSSGVKLYSGLAVPLLRIVVDTTGSAIFKFRLGMNE
jgi:hypothetical protein